MKKMTVAILAVALILAMFCGQALAVTGDITIKDAKAYSDAAMTNYVGTIPAGTALLVRAYDSYADVYVNGKVVYIKASALLNDDIDNQYVATLVKGTKVYQRADADARYGKVKRDGNVQVCAVSGDWALVRTTGSKAVFGFVKVDQLTGIRLK